MRINYLSVAALAAVFAHAPQEAHAGSQFQPGTTTGLAIAAPLPEGLYDIILPNWGARDTHPATDVGVLTPAWIVWSTPWTLLGGRLGFDAATPVAQVSIDNPVGLNKAGWTNPLVEMSLKWDLGNHFFFGVHEGVHLPVEGPLEQIGVAYDFATFMQVAALSYLNDGWNLSATFLYGTGRNGTTVGSFAPSWFNYDLTATKTFGKWEIGAVGFGSTDLSSPYAGYARQSQFALGGLVGYNFGPVDLQLKLTTDVAEQNYGGRDTRLWANIVLPIWTAASRK
ncbi:transporter [Rhodoblastus acidophilus]|uniref:Transporter n=1 Tax=Candidatus Rhodoblastus alkanivorans TaxID=2954117 RepID=A0ABS9Z2F6_9HYPH|nr:transporter [Candidatus Rhodoblastus alkanivorans]MCI4677433.1 transporter [Candidatus Rhodoblastus alkanivorans]MCI4681792.1 transporter [Candidatus Rhodoblastus alkanivorans]MDI4642842.1 transporter [Rhodoblastus acidophilus]